MTDPSPVPEEARESAYAARYGEPVDTYSWDYVADAVLAAAAHDIRAAQRDRLAAVISPDQFRQLADWFDTDDEFKEAMFPETWSQGSRADDLQRDLRRFADLLAGDHD